MEDVWKRPVLGIMTYKSGTLYEHTYGVIFDAADGAQLSHVRMINYAGLPTPPCAAPTDKGMPADTGIFLPITAESAEHLVQQIDALKADLTAHPPIKRYFYSKYVTPDTQKPKPAGNEQKFAHSQPTNCAHFLLQSMQRAGIDVAAIDPAWLDADSVEQISHRIEKSMAGAGRNSVCHGIAVNGQPLLYYQSEQERSLLPLLRTIPPEMLSALHDATPLTDVCKQGLNADLLQPREHILQ